MNGVRVTAGMASRGWDADVALDAGVTALVGPNGAGKSTLIGLVSGQLRPESGSVSIGGEVVATPRSQVPPHRRNVALLDQRPLLFPHLDVAANVAFGVRSRGASPAAARRRALAELDAVGAAGLAARRVQHLSGGEAQRVALARALATDPAVVLLDEPLASLDVDTAASMRRLLARRLADASLVVALVTHDPLDLWTLANRIVAFDAGRVAASGDVADVLGRPSSPFLARLSGVNLLQGVADRVADETGSDLGMAVGDDHVAGLWDDERRSSPGHATLATFTPSAVALFRTPPSGSPRNTWPVRVERVESRGATVRVGLLLGDGQRLSADLTPQGAAALGLAPGDRVSAQVKATQVSLYARA